jgi:hypothetical protein
MIRPNPQAHYWIESRFGEDGMGAVCRTKDRNKAICCRVEQVAARSPCQRL